jgi:hypothetical protein
MSKRLTVSLVMASLLGSGASGPLLAQESEREPVGFGGPVEVPEAGYALTAPEGWVTVHPSAEDVSAIADALADIDPDLAATVETALAGEVSFSFSAFGAFDVDSGFRQNCNVIDYPTDGVSLDLAVATDAAAVIAMGDQVVSGPETTMLELPAGESARLDYGLRFPALETVHSAYYFTDSSTFHLLTCTDLVRADDDWLSIAETFEFLSAEE